MTGTYPPGGTGLVEHPRHHAAGDGALLVVVDTRAPYWERVIVDETVLVALEHFGMPYRLHDLADGALTEEALTHCAGAVLAQNGLGDALGQSGASLLAAAVDAGTGLVNLDYDLRRYAAPFLEIFGFEGIKPYPYATDLLRVRATGHYVTGLQEAGELHQFSRMVTAIAVEAWREDVVPLADGLLGKDQLIYIRHLVPGSAFEPRNYPLLFAARWGRGKAVQFTLNQRVWKRAFYGHARDLDDVLWRSLVWAARKPFAAHMVLPFVALSIDDCRGRHDFGYVDVATSLGHVITPSLFLDRVPERLFGKIREGCASGGVEYGPHGLDYYDLLVYDFGKGELAIDELERRFARVDQWWERLGARPGRTTRFHWGEYGVRALPFLKERGYRYFCPALQTGLQKADMALDEGFWPYGLQTCYYDYLPDDHDILGFGAMPPRGQEDFLTGHTPYLRERDTTDVEGGAASAAWRIRHGLRAGFHAEVITHEQKFDSLSLDEWEQILRRAGEMTSRFDKIYATHDQIGDYYRGKDGTTIATASRHGDGLRCTLAGHTATPLSVSVFRDHGDDVSREYASVDAFDGEAVVEAG
ncbi:hypothetical protein ACFL6X_03155 [Candidatus Latescibacterota bacterium]